ncbi:AAA-domain-containing protein [Wallemia mellicola]|uniref:AAA-domain-containing protein n=1 Tax=Wallemia mellicola TaxID=1708541 RepID=A0AB38N1W0_9BASI|nr:AAA-domain-containing protein [Wallemia mellicola]
MSGSLNRSMQDLWSQSRTRVATPPQGSAAHAAAQAVEAAAQAEVSVHKPAPVEETPPEAQSEEAVKREDIDGQSKKRKKTSKEVSTKRARPTTSSHKNVDKTPPTARLADLGGVSECVERMLELVAMPLSHPEVYLHTGVQPPRGVLLHGPPGCGKTLLANAIAGEMGVPFLSISAPSVVSGMSGESEKTIRDTFEDAIQSAPCLLFIDEIDAITPKRENAQREMERRIVAQLLTCIDDISWDKTDNKPVIIIGATNRPDSLDPALRRAGRFDHEISMGVPDDKSREQILKVLCGRLKLSGDFDFKYLAKATPGYVGADLSALTGAAGVIAVKRIFKQLADDNQDSQMSEVGQLEGQAEDQVEGQMSSLQTLAAHLPKESTIAHFLLNHPNPLSETQLERLAIEAQDFEKALKVVQPSSKREGFATVPDVTWGDIGALHEIRDELHMAIVQPIRHPELFAVVGINAPCGVLLWGPPGCGKTLLAKAVANESRANFISVKGPELLNKYVGESERAIRQVFNRARASSPCVIFFDELDALVPRRDDNLSESSARVVNTLLTELDGLESRKQVFVIGATNRPDIIDPAMVRPGRLDKLLYVDLPSAEERVQVVRTLSSKTPINEKEMDIVCEVIQSEKCSGFSGADLASLVRESAVVALRESLVNETSNVVIESRHFLKALEKVTPSVSISQVKKYDNLRAKLMGLPGKSTSKNE